MTEKDHKQVNEQLVFGFDVGIASCGWAVIDKTAGREKIVAIGTHCFEKPEVAQTGELLNKDRRVKRGQRRVIGRRAIRLRHVRGLIRNHVLPSLPRQKSPKDIFDIRDFHQRVEGRLISDRREKDLPIDNLPWRLRVEALGHKLTPEETLLVLTHLAKHRGFKSNSKSDGNNEKSNGGKMLSATSASAEILAQFRSFADMLMKDPRFAGHKRNRPDQYSHTPLRQWIEDEARTIIAAQKRHGASWADDAFADEYIDAAFSQRPLQSAETMFGDCPF
jgi:CRISPR-associated endonuclease Csn1